MSTIKDDREDAPFPAEIVSTSDEASALKARPGWQTAHGILTGLVVLAAFGYLFFGPSFAADRLNSAVAGALAVAEKLGPVIAAVVALRTYTNSRGKIQSNELWANAFARNPLAGLVKGPLAGTDAVQPMAQGLLGGLGGAAGAVLGGKDWKDPARYANITDLAAEIAGGKAGKVIGAVRGGGAGQGVSSGDFETVVRALMGRLEELERGGQLTSESLARVNEYLDDLAAVELYLYVKGGWGQLDASNTKLRDAVKGVAAVARQGLSERKA